MAYALSLRLVPALAVFVAAHGCTRIQTAPQPQPSVSAVDYVPFGKGAPSGYDASGRVAYAIERPRLSATAAALTPRPTEDEPGASGPGEISDEDLALLEAELADADVERILATSETQPSADTGPALDDAVTATPDPLLGPTDFDDPLLDADIESILNDPLLNSDI